MCSSEQGGKCVIITHHPFIPYIHMVHPFILYIHIYRILRFDHINGSPVHAEGNSAHSVLPSCMFVSTYVCVHHVSLCTIARDNYNVYTKWTHCMCNRCSCLSTCNLNSIGNTILRTQQICTYLGYELCRIFGGVVWLPRMLIIVVVYSQVNWRPVRRAVCTEWIVEECWHQPQIERK